MEISEGEAVFIFSPELIKQYAGEIRDADYFDVMEIGDTTCLNLSKNKKIVARIAIGTALFNRATRQCRYRYKRDIRGKRRRG
jgi:hypothetical protein